MKHLVKQPEHTVVLESESSLKRVSVNVKSQYSLKKCIMDYFIYLFICVLLQECEEKTVRTKEVPLNPNSRKIAFMFFLKLLTLTRSSTLCASQFKYERYLL